MSTNVASDAAAQTHHSKNVVLASVVDINVNAAEQAIPIIADTPISHAHNRFAQNVMFCDISRYDVAVIAKILLLLIAFSIFSVFISIYFSVFLIQISFIFSIPL